MKQDYNLSKNIFSENIYQLPPKIGIILNIPWSQLPKKEIDLLEGILKAIQHSLAGVQIIEYSAFRSSEGLKKSRKIISFGVSIPNAKLYERVVSPDTDLILADTLTELLSNEILKKKLWLLLQQSFCRQD